MKRNSKTSRMMRSAVSLLLILCLSAAFTCAAWGSEDKDQQDGFERYTDETIHVNVFGEDMAVHHIKTSFASTPLPILASSGNSFFLASEEASEESAITYEYETMHVYIPENATADSPIILAVNNSGWAPSLGDSTNDRYYDIHDGSEFSRGHSSTNHTEAAGLALEAGYVVVTTGNLGRPLITADGEYIHSPANVVDVKAAVRMLRYMGEEIVGNTDRIIVTGLSGGGALSSTVAASGNNAAYYPYLYEIGAAGIDCVDGEYVSDIDDDVFAVVCYCPITDLEHADFEYEWTYQALRQAQAASGSGLNAEQLEGSALLAERFGPYFESLALEKADGTGTMTADDLLKDIQATLEESVEKALAEYGELVDENGYLISVPAFPDTSYRQPNDFLTVNDDGTVKLDYDAFLAYFGSSLRGLPSFDSGHTDYTGFLNETSVYGTREQEYTNIQFWAWAHNNTPGDGIGLDDTGLTFDEYLETDAGVILQEQFVLNNAIPQLLETEGAIDSAPYWYLRHGMTDLFNTSLGTIAVVYEAAAHAEDVRQLNFAWSWLVGHAGHYDAPEAYEWIAEIVDIADAFDRIEAAVTDGDPLPEAEGIVYEYDGSTVTVTVTSDHTAVTDRGEYNYGKTSETRTYTLADSF